VRFLSRLVPNYLPRLPRSRFTFWFTQTWFVRFGCLKLTLSGSCTFCCFTLHWSTVLPHFVSRFTFLSTVHFTFGLYAHSSHALRVLTWVTHMLPAAAPCLTRPLPHVCTGLRLFYARTCITVLRFSFVDTGSRHHLTAFRLLPGSLHASLFYGLD